MESEETLVWTYFQPDTPLAIKLESIFHSVVAPIYGSQSSSFERIRRAKDRKCEILTTKKNQEILGFIVYKTLPNSDYKRYSVSNSFEIKNFVVLDTNQVEPETEYAGVCLSTARKLYAKLQGLALQSGAETMHFIISEKQLSAFNFFKSQNFMSKKRWKSEHLLSCPIRYQTSRSAGRDSRPLRMTLHNQYIRAIRDGQKTVEGRCATTMFTPIRVGRILEFFCRTDSIKCEVISVHKYKSFPDMLREEGVDKCIPGIRSMKEACDVYNRLPGYTEKAARFGVLAFRLRAIT